jgi:hypothetical protein
MAEPSSTTTAPATITWTGHFPTAHTDFLTQYIDYRVPVDRFDDLAAFDGSCLADRTAGEAAAR